MNDRAERLSGWGRYPVAECMITRPRNAEAVPPLLSHLPKAIARGNGRSYGDASLAPDATVDLRRLDHFIDFDRTSGCLTCEGGALLADIVDTMLPRGWFVPVTPGTKLVTVGGMIASDVHGKNHHVAGSFCDHVEWIDLAIGAGEVLRCSPGEHADLFAATCGGMGLTGVILRACFRLLRVESTAVRQRIVRAATLADAFEIFEASLDWTYSVAWIDCLAQGRHLGRSAIFLGEHALSDQLPPARQAAPLARHARRTKHVPFDFPAFVLSRPSVRLFNRLYYAAQRPGNAIVDIDPFFYPLDAVHDWNRIYGRPGFIQYQCVLPLAESEMGLTRLLREIAAVGEASFLAVLKRMGPASFGMLSFPMEGYTLALDFPANRGSFALLDRLDAITAEHGGHIYLAKDARAGATSFANGYARLDEFRAVRAHYGLDQHFASLLSRRLEI
ncbi:FAD linked oxidase domain protein [Sphingobium chlorophenolicum L-1]|uniref:FAD linked oxidase domain protein n=2 Tax=Sphingobium chlorophenolicum TaxID=46429 RepID=F6F0S3_SPHCR|nr:FAD linked oxidase domain protein [Sphingobium chlorophenolicum L-1]